MVDYIEGLKKAIDMIIWEYELCSIDFEDEEYLKYIKMAFCRAISLIEDEMLQCGEVFEMNYYVDKLDNE